MSNETSIPNRATIYSNGIADFQRVYPVSKSAPAKISIPVRQQHLADVLASLTIMGDVRIEAPPSFQPANQDDSNVSISSENTLLELAKQLSGANIVIKSGENSVEGQLVGLHNQQVGTGGQSISEPYLVVLVDNSIQRHAVKEIQEFQFTDPVIQSEIKKALSRRLREIKPNSTFVDLELSTTTTETSAIVQYTIPAAAWKISYRIILADNSPIGFHGHAIVDNNTDEDWENFLISVVIGQPITFTTDLADSKTPLRSHVNIVQDSAFGAVEVEELADMDEVKTMAAYESMDYGGGVDKFALGAPAAKMRQAHIGGAGGGGRERGRTAGAAEAEVAETGDFCIYETADPVSIDAHRSAVIPVFQTTLDESRAVLHYKYENHPDRPFRAIKFKNTTEHSLGRGVCTVYDESTYVGTCVLPATKPDDDAILPHALETGVKVRHKQMSTKTRRVSIRISEGTVYQSNHQTSETQITIDSRQTDSFPAIVDHDRNLHESKIECSIRTDGAKWKPLDVKELRNGCRFEFDIAEKAKVELRIVETKVAKSSFRLTGDTVEKGDLRIQWLLENIVESDMPIANDQAIKNCLEIQSQMDEIKNEMIKATKEIERLEQRQERLRKNIKTGGGEKQNLKWQTDLGKSEDLIVELGEKKIPELQKAMSSLRKQLFEGLRRVALEWNAK